MLEPKRGIDAQCNGVDPRTDRQRRIGIGSHCVRTDMNLPFSLTTLTQSSSPINRPASKSPQNTPHSEWEEPSKKSSTAKAPSPCGRESTPPGSVRHPTHHSVLVCTNHAKSPLDVPPLKTPPLSKSLLQGLRRVLLVLWRAIHLM